MFNQRFVYPSNGVKSAFRSLSRSLDIMSNQHLITPWA